MWHVTTTPAGVRIYLTWRTKVPSQRVASIGTKESGVGDQLNEAVPGMSAANSQTLCSAV
jgi:hypothetical protein